MTKDPGPPTKSTASGPITDTAELKGRRVHFAGIGGCGMSGLARLVRAAGAVCSGSDLAGSTTVDALRADGIEVGFDQSAGSLPEDCGLLVISAAIPGDHAQVTEALRRQVPVLKYAQMLGRLMIGRSGVAIAGTHGKSTTTSMLCHALIEAGLDPSFIVGANCPQIGGGARCGRPDVLVAEACEFDRSFHNLNPTHAVILNVEEDHMDVYGSIDAIVEAFSGFAQLTPAEGSLLIQHECSHRLAITAGLGCEVQSIGFAPQADWRVQLKIGGETGDTADLVELFHGEKQVAQWSCEMAGEHMAYNTAVAAVTAHRLGAAWPAVSAAMTSFQGLERRMQVLGSRRLGDGEVTVIDDYGHHPTEIDTTIRALRQRYKPGRLLCVFQPHQHSRTRFLMAQFAASFHAADIVIVPDIYFVRDSDAERHTVRAADLVDRLRSHGKQALHVHPFEAIVEQLEVIARPGDLVVTMGAGDVWQIARGFLDGGMA